MFAPRVHGSRIKSGMRGQGHSPPCLPSALAGRAGAAGRGRRGVAAEARDGLQRVMELEVLYALGLELLRGGGEARIRLAVVLDDVVVDLDLVDQVAPQIRLAKPR